MSSLVHHREGTQFGIETTTLLAAKDLLEAKAKLRKTETKVTTHPTIDELCRIKGANPELMKFYEKIIVTAESERNALKKEIPLRIGHRVENVGDDVSS